MPQVTIQSTASVADRLVVMMDKELFTLKIETSVGGEGNPDTEGYTEHLAPLDRIDLTIEDINVLEDLIEEWKYRYYDRNEVG